MNLVQIRSCTNFNWDLVCQTSVALEWVREIQRTNYVFIWSALQVHLARSSHSLVKRSSSMVSLMWKQTLILQRPRVSASHSYGAFQGRSSCRKDMLESLCMSKPVALDSSGHLKNLSVASHEKSRQWGFGILTMDHTVCIHVCT